MSDQEKFLYHCDRCGELFKSIKQAQDKIECSVCGKHPVRSKFATVAEMPVLDENEKKSKRHGISVMDEAAIFSMKQKKMRKNWTYVCLLWIVGLAVLALMANRMNSIEESGVKDDEELGEEDNAYVARKIEAREKCLTRFREFAASTIVQSKSFHIINSNDLILDIDRYYQRNLIKNDLVTSSIVKYDLIENEEQSKFTALYRYTPRKEQPAETYDFEVIFWKSGDDWLIDWPHFVRLGDMSWFRFGEVKRLNSPKRFKLYVREPNTDSLGLSGYEEYKLSEAFNTSALPSQLEKSVFVKYQTDLRTKLTKAFEQLRDSENQSIPTDSGFQDPPRKIRVDVTVEYQEVEGNTVIVLEEIHGFEWETPPSLNKN